MNWGGVAVGIHPMAQACETSERPSRTREDVPPRMLVARILHLGRDEGITSLDLLVTMRHILFVSSMPARSKIWLMEKRQNPRMLKH